MVFQDAIPLKMKKLRKVSHHELLPNVPGSGELLKRQAVVCAKDEATTLIHNVQAAT